MYITLLCIALATLATSQDEELPECRGTDTPACCPELSFSSEAYLGGPCGDDSVTVTNLTDCSTSEYPNGFMCCIETVSSFSFPYTICVLIARKGAKGPRHACLELHKCVAVVGGEGAARRPWYTRLIEWYGCGKKNQDGDASL